MPQNRANIDGDILLYSVGHATDDRYYTLNIVGVQQRFKYKKDAEKYAEMAYIPKETIQFHREAAPEAFYYHALKIKIQSILQATECDEYTLYLTGKNNFREKLAVTHKYKGNRPEDGKPLLYQEMKDYLIRNHPVVIAEDREADDLLGINQTEDTVLCSTDKDLDQIPGFHYNFQQNELYYIPESYATYWGMLQLATGDLIDNIHGLKGIGYKKAGKLLKGLPKQEMLCSIGLQYAIQFDNPEDYLWEVAGLIEMHRELDDILAPGQRLLGEMYVQDNC